MNKTSRKYIILRAVLLGLTVIAIAFLATRNLYHREEAKKDALRRIRERGYLIALTDQNTLNYFIYKGEPMGYQLKMLESFAKYLGVPLRIIASNDISKLEYYLWYNAADLIALNLPITGDGKKLVRFSDPFGETRLVLVQRKNTGISKDSPAAVSSLKDFPRDTVYVRKTPFLTDLYHAFYKKTGKNAILKEVADISQEELIKRVSSGAIRFAICQENVAMMYHRFYRNLDISVLAFPLFSYGWAVGHASDSLRTEVNGWLKQYKASRDLKQTYLEYFDNQRLAGLLQNDYFSVNGEKLSPFDDVIREQSKLVRWDWRLIASLIYEESNFKPGLVSSRNASGLMQLMPETAAKFGIDSASTPARQIAGGVKYLRFINSQLPDEITSPVERIYFVLASYNVGIGRVLAAREKAEKFGKDKNRWNGHVDYYLLRRSKKDPVAKSDSADSYPVDYKTEGFVDDIVSRYYHYKNLIK
ncbi:MAG: transglycosylase SLT domain-containing protein [Bacteroidetes bacterium]|nr:transglycosylase SLT domain-containing protein [Bacteroidota bacterium]